MAVQSKGAQTWHRFSIEAVVTEPSAPDDLFMLLLAAKFNSCLRLQDLHSFVHELCLLRRRTETLTHQQPGRCLVGAWLLTACNGKSAA